MPQYIDMSISEGRKCLPNIQTLFFRTLKDESYFAEPWKNRKFADCAEFRLGNGRDGSDEVFFFVSDEELTDFLKSASGELYLFGAYNQINVCQMRARGTVVFEDRHSEVDQIKARLRTKIKSRVGSFFNKLDEAEAEDRYAILNNGLLFCFRVEAYAYHAYQRG